MTMILNNNNNIGSEILYEVMFGKGKCFFPGGFKPPHVGHYEALKDLVSRSYITEVEVIISSKPREGITAEESKAIWDIFLKAQPLQKVKVVISPDPSPIIPIYHYLEAYPQEVPVYLAGGEDDQGYFDSLQKRFGDQVLTISIDDKVGRISGTYVREVLRSGDYNHFKECLPPAVVNKGYADDIFAIVSKTASQEKSTVKEKLNEGVIIQVQTKPLSSEVNLPDFFSYVCRMLEIEKAPKLILLDKPIMGETDGQPSFASYDPSTCVVNLYKEKRHIVDSMRSLAHEMCHHRQNELNQLTSNIDGETGSEIENEANSVAGMLVRKYGKDNPQIYF